MDYRIGGHNIRLLTDGDEAVLDTLLPSFLPFKTAGSEADSILFTLRLAQTLHEMPQEERRLIRDVDTGNGFTRVERLTDGGYQFLIRDIQGQPCALLITSPRFDNCRCAVRGNEATRRFALNNALMLTFAFSASRHDTLLVHASVVRHNGRAYAFTAKSGTGKSTHVANWLGNIEGCDMVNDDNPIVRIVDGKALLYGSPWSGKTPCYRNITVPLGAVTLIERDTRNHVEPQPPTKAFITLLTACSSMKWDEDIYKVICNTVTRLVALTRVATLHCLPDADSAMVCRKALEDGI